MPRRYESCGLLTGKSSSVMDWLLEGDPFWLTFSTSLELFRHGQGFSLLSLTQSHSRIGLDLLDGSSFSRQPARNSIENRDSVRQNAIVTCVINPRKACRSSALIARIIRDTYMHATAAEATARRGAGRWCIYLVDLPASNLWWRAMRGQIQIKTSDEMGIEICSLKHLSF